MGQPPTSYQGILLASPWELSFLPTFFKNSLLPKKCHGEKNVLFNAEKLLHGFLSTFLHPDLVLAHTHALIDTHIYSVFSGIRTNKSKRKFQAPLYSWYAVETCSAGLSHLSGSEDEWIKDSLTQVPFSYRERGHIPELLQGTRIYSNELCSLWETFKSLTLPSNWDLEMEELIILVISRFFDLIVLGILSFLLTWIIFN